MTTIQTNVRVQPEDKPLLRAIAARLRLEPHFRDRVRALIEDDPTPALRERIEKLEERVEWLLAGGAAGALSAPAFAVSRASNGSNGSHAA